MSIVTRLEAPFSVLPGNVAIYQYPHGGAPVALTLSAGTYPHKWMLLDEINDQFTANGHPLTITQTSTGSLLLASSASTFDFYFEATYGNEGLKDFLGFSTDTYEDIQRVSASPTSTLLLDACPTDEMYTIEINRASNFADDGRVAGVLLGRYVSYACSLHIDNDEHDAFRAFWPWIAESRKLTIWRRWDTTSGDDTTYLMSPLLGDAGFKFLSLTDDSPDDLDAPRDAPGVTGHTHDIEGVVYGI